MRFAAGDGQKAGETMTKLPGWFEETTGVLKCIEAAGAWWITNGHAMVRASVEDTKGLPVLPDEARGKVAECLASGSEPMPMGFPYVARRDGSELRDYQCDIGPVVLAFAYVALIERRFPGCMWAHTGWWSPVLARVDGAIVAAVMPSERQPRSGA